MKVEFQDETSLGYVLKKAIGEAASKVMGKKIKPGEVHLEHPDNEKYGDFSANIALRFKVQGSRFKVQGPRKLAEEIVKRLKQKEELSDKVESIEAAGVGFINIRIKNQWFISQIEKVIEGGENYGTSEVGKGQTWLIEHTSPNPNKAMHLGHLRNNVIGMAIANIWEGLGIKVVRDCIDNNRGIAIAKLMWGYLKFARRDGKEIVDIDYWYKHQDEWQTSEDLSMRPDKFVDQLYVKASEDFKKKEAGKRVRKLVVDWEAEDKKTWALWKKVLNYSYQGQQLTLKRLGNKWDKVWHEHEHYKQGKDLVKEGLEKGIFKKLSDGAILSDLKRYSLTDTILIKSDGSALYITQDLALTKLKKETFKPDKMFWVIGPEQSLALKQLFAICKQLGVGKLSDFTHIPYGYMSIKGQGKMSSRAGTVVYIDDLIDESKNIILKKIDAKRFKKGEIDILAEKIAVGAIKYSVLKVRRMSDIAFSFDESLAFEGDSGPYLQYTYARTQSVLRKFEARSTKHETNSNDKNSKPKKVFDLKNLNLDIVSDFGFRISDLNAEEFSILRWLYRYPEVVLEAGAEYAPNLICNFLYELAQRFNRFYAKHSILQPQNAHIASGRLHVAKNKIKTTSYKLRATSRFRLCLNAAVGQVLENGLELLGIESTEKM